jgi:hypothetical protein
MRSGSSVLALLLLVLTASGAAAQSLGELAKQEEARRKAIRSSGKVYTNGNLEAQPAPATPPAAASQPSAPAAPSASGSTPAASAPAGGASSAPASSTPKTEADWRKRISDERDALSRAQIFADALQTRINALSTDFVNTDDPAKRDMVAADRQKSLSELDRVRQEIQQHQKAITDVQDEARRAGVPAGWVR